MKTFCGLLVVLCCIAFSSGTLKTIKQAARAASFLHSAATRLSPVNFVAPPIIVSQSVPVPTVYSRPISSFSAQVSTYSSDLPPPPVPAYQPPAATYRPPAPVYGPPQPVATFSRPIITLRDPYCEAEIIPVVLEAW